MQAIISTPNAEALNRSTKGTIDDIVTRSLSVKNLVTKCCNYYEQFEELSRRDCIELLNMYAQAVRNTQEIQHLQSAMSPVREYINEASNREFKAFYQAQIMLRDLLPEALKNEAELHDQVLDIMEAAAACDPTLGLNGDEDDPEFLSETPDFEFVSEPQHEH